MTGPALAGVVESDAVIVTVGSTVVGATVVGATVVGATVVGATVVGATVVGDALAVALAVADLEVVGVAAAFAAGVVAVVPGVDAPVVVLTTGPTVVPVVGAVSRAPRIGGSPALVPDRFVDPPIALGLALPLPLAWAAEDSIGSAVGAGQSAALQAMNPPTELD